MVSLSVAFDTLVHGFIAFNYADKGDRIDNLNARPPFYYLTTPLNMILDPWLTLESNIVKLMVDVNKVYKKIGRRNFGVLCKNIAKRYNS